MLVVSFALKSIILFSKNQARSRSSSIKLLWHYNTLGGLHLSLDTSKYILAHSYSVEQGHSESGVLRHYNIRGRLD